MTSIKCRFAASLLFLLSTFGVSAIEVELAEKVHISGNAGTLSFSPYQLSALSKNLEGDVKHTLYAIDYEELKRQIKIYQQIYVTGQILHGYLMIKMKPKFVK